MDPKYYRNDSGLHYDNTVPPTHRPGTPLYLMQQSNEEQYQRGLKENLTSYMTSSAEGRHENSELNDSLLPKDVNYYYIEKEKVGAKVEIVFQREKESIDALFD